ncbi:T-cell-interacting, activating receptor on myeloid cells protein 1-like [Thomomys bottae]
MVSPFPRPTLSALPSSVVPAGSNVTLLCTSPIFPARVALRKGGAATPGQGKLWGSAQWRRQGAEFQLTEVRQSDAGPYTCDYHRVGYPETVSEPSEALLLLVTGDLPSPSLRSHPSGRVAVGGQVTLQCHRPDNSTDYTTFALLREGATSPTQLQGSGKDSVTFVLPRVTGGDAGCYRCVYFQAQAPLRASNLSEPVRVVVIGLPRPHLGAWPSSVVLAGDTVSLECTSPTPGVYLVLRKGEQRWRSRLANPLTQGTAAFPLTHVRPSDTGLYTCEYYRKGSPEVVSEPSKALRLLVAGDLPSPSLRSHPSGRVAVGGQVTLQCHRPDNSMDYTTFALLKEGATSPTQLQGSGKDSVTFILPRVTGGDAGCYRCVYFQAQAPFQASNLSEPVRVVVAASIIARGRHKFAVIRLGMAAVVLLLLSVFLVEAWYSRRASPRQPRWPTATS